MSNFEIIDDYLANRLSVEDKAEFEKQIESDARLKSDVELQRSIVEGVKQARVAELKAMLNQIPVPGGMTAGIATGKVAASIVVAGILGTALYFYLKPTPSETPANSSAITNADSVSQLTIVTPSEDTKTVDPPAAVHSTPKTTNSTERKVPVVKDEVTPERKKIEVTDPSDELVGGSSKETQREDNNSSAITTSKIVVETMAATKKYSFNYQFAESKLILYGPFDKALYEILEIHGDHNTLFLYYKGNYYLLDEKQTSIAPLSPIRDTNLIKKLKEYRGN